MRFVENPNKALEVSDWNRQTWKNTFIQVAKSVMKSSYSNFFLIIKAFVFCSINYICFSVLDQYSLFNTIYLIVIVINCTLLNKDLHQLLFCFPKTNIPIFFLLQKVHTKYTPSPLLVAHTYRSSDTVYKTSPVQTLLPLGSHLKKRPAITFSHSFFFFSWRVISKINNTGARVGSPICTCAVVTHGKRVGCSKKCKWRRSCVQWWQQEAPAVGSDVSIQSWSCHNKLFTKCSLRKHYLQSVYFQMRCSTLMQIATLTFQFLLYLRLAYKLQTSNTGPIFVNACGKRKSQIAKNVL